MVTVRMMVMMTIKLPPTLVNIIHITQLACLPANNKLHKTINKNTIKLSYSCMSNIKQSIANHNKAILSKEKIKEEQIKLCNCRNRTLCPLQGNCLQKGVVFQATVTQTNTLRRHLYRNNRERVQNTI